MVIYVIDVGTSSMRGILYNENAEVLTQKQRTYTPQYLPDDRVEQDPAVLEESLIDLCRALSEYCSEHEVTPDVISITSQRSSVIALSKEGTALSPAIMWQDKRTIPYEQKMAPYGDLIFSRTGSRINPVFSGCKMAWIHEHQPELYEQAYKLVVIPDFLIHRMTGQLCTDYTYGSRSLLMNLNTCTWDTELLDLFDIDVNKLCTLIPPGSVCGCLTREFAALCSLPEGLPVVTAGGDQQCAALGLGIMHHGDLEITAGTGAFLLAGIDAVPQSLKPDVICSASAIPGRYLLESSILTCCSAFDWFHRTFYPECAPDDYSVINLEISNSSPGPCIVLPYFQGRATPDWNSRAQASFHHLSLAATRGDLARALLEGICYEINCNRNIIKEYTGTIRTVRSCGGLTKNPSFPQMEADILQEPVSLFHNGESTALGAWIQAAMALGLFTDYSAAFETCRRGDQSTMYEPSAGTKQFYMDKQEQFEILYRNLYRQQS